MPPGPSAHSTPASDPLAILLAHNLWANRSLLDACAALSDEQWRRRFDIGPGSLHDTMTHIVGAMRVWNDVLARREVRPRIEGSRYSVAEVRALHDEAGADLATQAASEPLDRTVTRTREGQTYTFTRGGVLTHVTTHGVHHRAQALNVLRQLGVTKSPASAVVEWMRMGEPR